MLSSEELTSMVLLLNRCKVEGDRLWRAILEITRDEDFDIEILELMRSVAGGRLPKETLIQALEKFKRQENLNISKGWKRSHEQQQVKNTGWEQPLGFGGNLKRVVAGNDQAIGMSRKQENLNISKGSQKSHKQQVKNRKGKQLVEADRDLTMRAVDDDDQAIGRSKKQENLNISKGCHEQEVKNTKGKEPVEYDPDLMMRAVAGDKQLPEEWLSQVTAKYSEERGNIKISIDCQRRFYEHGGSSGLKHHKRVKTKHELPLEEFENQELPVETMNKIRDIGGYDEKLVAHKILLHSDIDTGQNRFLIPRKQSNRVDFLTDDEKLRLAKYRETKKEENDLEVLLVEPSLKEDNIRFREWLNGTRTNYLLTSGCKWSTVVDRNRLRENDIVQLWSFRRYSKLCFALVIVERAS